MKIFRKKRTATPSPLWHLMGEMSDKRVRKITDYLNKRVNSMPVVWVKVWFFCFCIVWGFVFAWIGFHKTEVLPPNNIVVPLHLERKNAEMEAVISPDEYKRVKDFHQHMDSLKRIGNHYYDSLVKIRPFLMDSCKLVERIYESQINNNGKK